MKEDILFILTTLFLTVLILFMIMCPTTPAIQKVSALMNETACERDGGAWASVRTNQPNGENEWSFKCRCPVKNVSVWITEGEPQFCN